MIDLFQDCMNKAKAAGAAKDWPVAERWYGEAVRLQPTSSAAQRGLGIAFVSQRKLEGAETAWRAVMKLEPRAADSHYMLGSIMMVQRQLAEAEALLTRALELNPNLAPAAFELGRIAYAQENVGRAAQFFQRAIAINPLHVNAIASLMQTLVDLQLTPDAITLGKESLARLQAQTALPPVSYNIVHSLLAQAYRYANDLPAAAACYRAILATDPADKVAAHLLAAAEGDVSQDFAKDFAKASFEALAEGFDHRLVDQLKYRAPGVLAQVLWEIRADKDGFAAVLDLGCGTGLIGAALGLHFAIRKLVGVDLSPNMLREAEKRGLYGELICDDVVSAMYKRDDRFDLIMAADVLVYVGALEKTFEQASRVLNAGGMFVFTVEASATADLELESTGHYRHGKAYIARLAEAQGFEIARLTEDVIRTELNRDIAGLYVYLTKSN